MNIYKLMPWPVTVLLGVYCLYWYSSKAIETFIPRQVTAVTISTPTEILTIPDISETKVLVKVDDAGDTKITIKEVEQ